LKIATRSSLLAALGAALITAGALRWWIAAPSPLSPTQLIAALPRGSSVHSLVQLEMDGLPPGEAAAVARIPAYPGARQLVSTALLYRYDRWRRRFTEVYRAPAPGAVPFSAEAVPAAGRLEAALFSGLDDDGALRYRVVALFRGGLLLLKEGRRPEAARPDGLPPAPPAATWRYAVRAGTVAAPTAVVRLRVRQPLRIVAVGGGPASVVLPDPRLDLVEAGYRSRAPGIFHIRIVTGFAPPETAYVLTVIVEP
jgi:hypothetical protein